MDDCIAGWLGRISGKMSKWINEWEFEWASKWGRVWVKKRMSGVMKEQNVNILALHSQLPWCTWQCNHDATVAAPNLTRQLIEPLALNTFRLLPLDHHQTHARAVDWTAVQLWLWHQLAAAAKLLALPSAVASPPLQTVQVLLPDASCNVECSFMQINMHS